MIYKYVWQTCQQSLKIISIEQYFVRGNYTFSELCSSRKYPYPHPQPPLPTTEDRNSKGRGGPKGGNFRGVGGLLTIAYRGFLTRHPSPVTRHLLPVTRYPSPATRHPLPVTRYPSPATRHPSPVTRHPSPVTRHPSPVTRHPPPATRGKVLPSWQYFMLFWKMT